MENNFDVIVIGGGHAGIEAALIAKKMQMSVLLISQKFTDIGNMHCNISIGGPAKGIIVREIDSLGGMMAVATDNTMIQIKMLNESKGAAVWALRAQVDKVAYAKFMQKKIKEAKITFLTDLVNTLIIENKKVKGIVTENGKNIFSKSVIICTGTFLDSKIITGLEKYSSGPDNTKTSTGLSKQLISYGFEKIRLKTGTPPRIEKKSINFKNPILVEQKGTHEKINFSFHSNKYLNQKKEISCYLIHSNSKTHQIIQDNFHLSLLYSSEIKGIGPRYCPSIEDKVKRFVDKERHQFFLEPESLVTDFIYIQGLSTSLPPNIQEEIVHTIPSLEKGKILKYGYAIEYDAFNPIQLFSTLETKLLENLYFAGQINGTSGYEEAAAQGLIAGINASLKIQDKEPLILTRSDGYIGVLINDLITKGVIDPYRMLTSRAEHRLILRNDNVEMRLFEKGIKLGLHQKDVIIIFSIYKEKIKIAFSLLKEIRYTPKTKGIDKLVNKLSTTMLVEGISLYDFLKRPEVKLNELIKFEPELKKMKLSQNQISYIETSIKYEGYIEKIERNLKKEEKYLTLRIDNLINYQKIPNLANEAIEKLSLIKPSNIYEALNISGINPSDISILINYVRKNKFNNTLLKK